jgi:hypothetical protein
MECTSLQILNIKLGISSTKTIIVTAEKRLNINMVFIFFFDPLRIYLQGNFNKYINWDMFYDETMNHLTV